MYTVSLERIPLPCFSTYLFFSIFSFLGSLSYLIHDAYTGLHSGFLANRILLFSENSTYSNLTSLLVTRNFRYIADVCFEDTWCFWSIINLAYCGLILIGKTGQNIFFGELRAPEQQLIRDKFWNFVFYKLVFIYGILNVHTLHDLLLWATWSSILGFLHLLTHLTKGRAEFLVQSPETSAFQHLRLVSLLCSVLLSGGGLAALSLYIGVRSSLHLMLFMLAEVFQLEAVTVYALVRYAAHVYDKKAVFLYYADLIYHVAAHGSDLVHNFHMLFWNNIKVNMTGLVIGMHLQYLYYELTKRWKRHRRYMVVVKMIEEKFPLLKNLEDDCSICWERLGVCRMLPCSHLFHDSCLRSWIEQNTSCPTCRSSLQSPTSLSTTFFPYSDTIDSEEDPNVASVPGGHYLSPSGGVSAAAGDPSSLAMAASSPSSLLGSAMQIHSMFPRVPLQVILSELNRDESNPEHVVTAILEGRLHTTGPHLLTGPMQVELDTRRGDYPTVSHKLPFDHSDLDLDPPSNPARVYSDSDEAAFKFVKSKRSREVILANRKADMIQQAKQRYLEKLKQS